MKNKLFVTVLSSLLAFSWQGNTFADTNQSQESEIDYHCYRFPTKPICEDKESYISLEEWKEDKTECTLATEWSEKKCKVVVGDRELTIYVEQEVLSEDFPNTLKTKAITIPLDNIFAFNTQWWLANFKSIITHANNIYGSFPNLQIGFIPISTNAADTSGKFLTISAKNLHRTVEEIESWRYYLPDLNIFEAQLKFDPSKINMEQNIASNIARLEETNECPYCNLQNANLTEMNLDKANLQGVNLAGANLEGSSLKEAYLLGANLKQANLYQANLEEINLMFAALENADLSETNLKGSNLQNSNLNGVLLKGADLNASKLRNTNLKNATLISADLSDANLQCANLQSADLKNANLTSADLSSCERKSGNAPSINNRSTLKNLGINGGLEGLSGVLQITAAILTSVRNPGSSSNFNLPAPKTIFHLDTDLASANLSGANLTSANLSNAQLTDVNLSEAIFDDTKFAENNLSNANFINTDVSEVKFKDPELICEAIFSNEIIHEEYCKEEEEEKEK